MNKPHDHRPATQPFTREIIRRRLDTLELARPLGGSDSSEHNSSVSVGETDWRQAINDARPFLDAFGERGGIGLDRWRTFRRSAQRRPGRPRVVLCWRAGARSRAGTRRYDLGPHL